MSVEVICRVCGRKGREDPDDPAPGLCPACLEAAWRREISTGPVPFSDDPEERALLVAKMRALGITEAYIALVLAE